MPTFNLPNGTSPDDVLISVSQQVPVFPIMILVFTWCLVFFRGVIKQNDKQGYADLPQWATIASLSCLLLSLVMTIQAGLITLPILLVVMAITTLSGVWFFLSRGRYD